MRRCTLSMCAPALCICIVMGVMLITPITASWHQLPSPFPPSQMPETLYPRGPASQTFSANFGTLTSTCCWPLLEIRGSPGLSGDIRGCHNPGSGHLRGCLGLSGDIRGCHNPGSGHLRPCLGLSGDIRGCHIPGHTRILACPIRLTYIRGYPGLSGVVSGLSYTRTYPDPGFSFLPTLP